MVAVVDEEAERDAHGKDHALGEEEADGGEPEIITVFVEWLLARTLGRCRFVCFWLFDAVHAGFDVGYYLCAASLTNQPVS